MKNQKTIGIDIRPALYEKAGVGQYTLQLTQHLLDVDKKNKYILFCDKNFDLPIKGNFEKKIYTFRIKKLNTIYFHLKTIIDCKRLCDNYIATSALFIPALIKNFATLIVYDLTAINQKELHKFKTQIINKLLLKIAIKNSLNIISISDNTKKDIIKYVPNINKSKIHTIYVGANLDLLKSIEPYDLSYWSNVKTKFKISSNYILYIGTIEPRKNVLSLVKAYERLKTDKFQLVIVGRNGWKSEETFEYIEKLSSEIRNNVIITGMVSEKEKAYLLKNAFIFVYPSFYEGFGIPVLESIIFDIPFVTSNVSSIPEVAGNAGILIDPTNINEIKKSIQLLIDNKNLYNDYKNKSKIQLKKFDWKKIAKEVIELYT